MMQYNIVSNDDQKTSVIVIFPGDGDVVVANSNHPRWMEIVAAAERGDPAVLEMIDISKMAAQEISRRRGLSERVSYDRGVVYLDGDPLDGYLADDIVQSLDEGDEYWNHLVNFLDHVSTNPNPHSCEMLYGWLRRHGFQVREDGYIIAYKGIKDDGMSVSSGYAIVDGREYNGRIPNFEGATVEMPRSMVAHDPSNGCSTGLHVGTLSYASGFSQKLIRVAVHPRDVVSVPTDCDGQKMRVCRYIVLDEVTGVPVQSMPEVAPLGYDEEGYDEGYEEDDSEAEECFSCGDHECHGYQCEEEE